jgi:hypothetical protein
MFVTEQSHDGAVARSADFSPQRSPLERTQRALQPRRSRNRSPEVSPTSTSRVLIGMRTPHPSPLPSGEGVACIGRSEQTQQPMLQPCGKVGFVSQSTAPGSCGLVVLPGSIQESPPNLSPTRATGSTRDSTPWPIPIPALRRARTGVAKRSQLRQQPRGPLRERSHLTIGVADLRGFANVGSRCPVLRQSGRFWVPRAKSARQGSRGARQGNDLRGGMSERQLLQSA